MAETTVVHLKIKKGVVVQDCDLYIGRPMYQGGWRLPGSKWANPFRLDRFGGDRTRVLEAYEAHVRASPDLMAALPELRGLRLGCWCVEAHCLVCRRKRGSCGHLSCHGEVLLKLLAELDASAGAARDVLNPQNDGAGGPVDLIPDDDPLWTELGL